MESKITPLRDMLVGRYYITGDGQFILRVDRVVEDRLQHTYWTCAGTSYSGGWSDISLFPTSNYLPIDQVRANMLISVWNCNLL